MKRVSRAIGVVLLAFCVALAGCKSSKTVPDVVGQPQAGASTAIVGAGLVVGTITQAYSATVAAGLVISQTPAAGTSVKPDTAVDLVISQGPEPVAVPNVVGATQVAASSAIVGAGLLVGAVTQAYSATVAAGLVISQSPAAGTPVSAGTAVDLVISRGPEPVVATVPGVVGMTQAAASSAITGAGLVVGTVSQVFSDTVPSGSVVSQTPAAGTSVNPGTAVNLVVSRGPQPSVPNVAGLTQVAASSAITGAGLVVGTVTQVYSGTVASGTVISQTPAPGTLVNPGSAVNLVVSKGPQPVTVPDVTGMTQAAASTVIVGAGLVVGTVTEAYSDTVATGSVISQTPVVGTSVSPGSPVNLVVSKGPQPVIVPDVVNLTESAAGTAISNALLSLGTISRMYSDTVPRGSVVEQNPAAGTSVPPGTAVDLGVSKGPEFVIVPDVVGLTETAAGTAITNALLALGTISRMYSDTVPAGSVVQQNPLPGASVGQGTGVDLNVSDGPQPPKALISQARGGTATGGGVGGEASPFTAVRQYAALLPARVGMFSACPTGRLLAANRPYCSVLNWALARRCIS